MVLLQLPPLNINATVSQLLCTTLTGLIKFIPIDNYTDENKFTSQGARSREHGNGGKTCNWVPVHWFPVFSQSARSLILKMAVF